MKKLIVTYHMEKHVGGSRWETAETCIALPMSDANADYIMLRGIEHPDVEAILQRVARLQGYRYTETVHVREVPTDA